MANGYKFSVDLGENKNKPFTVANSAPGTAGCEVLIDATKYTTPYQAARELRRIAELILESTYPPA